MAVPLILVLCPGALQFDDCGAPRAWPDCPPSICSPPPRSPPSTRWPKCTIRTATSSATCPTRRCILRGPGHRHRAQDPRHRRAAVQSHRARLRRHPVGRHLRRGWSRKASSLDRAAPRPPGVHGGAPPRRHAAGPVQQEQRRGRRRNLPRPSRNAAAPRGLRRPRASTGSPRRATSPRSPKSWNSASTPSSWWTTTPRSAPRRRPPRPQVLALPLPARRRRDSRISCAHVWAFDRARVTDEDRRRARTLRPARGARAAPSAPPQPGRVSGLPRAGGPHRAHGAGAGGARRAAHPAHQPDECHLHPAHRGGNPARCGRGVPDRPRDATASAAMASPAR